jgi:hypothetical protein
MLRHVTLRFHAARSMDVQKHVPPRRQKFGTCGSTSLRLEEGEGTQDFGGVAFDAEVVGPVNIAA